MPCVVPGCGVVLSIETSGPNAGALRADLDTTISHIEAGTLPDLGIGWTADLTDTVTFPVGTPVTVAEMAAAETFENESACHAYAVMSQVAAREVRYDGDATAWFSLVYEADIDGAGYQTMFVYQGDYRGMTDPGGGLSSSIPGGSSVGGMVLPAGGSFTYRYRIRLTNQVDPGVGPADVTSPGLTFCHLGVID